MKKVAVIGAGIAGMTAAIYAVRGGAKVSIFEGASVGGQIAQTERVDNYPAAFGISGYELSDKIRAQAEELGVQFLYEAVDRIDVKTRTVFYGENQLKAGVLILAMGQRPRSLNIEGEKEFAGRGISYCATCDAMFFKGKKVAVIGGGNTAVQDALHLNRFASEVSIVHRRETYRADKIEVDKLNRQKKIKQLLGKVPVKVIGDKTVTGLEIANAAGGGNEMLHVDGVFLAVGYLPNSQLVAGQIELDESGYIVADGEMKTSVKNVYACGDVVRKEMRQLVTAASDGAIAGHQATAN